MNRPLEVLLVLTFAVAGCGLPKQASPEPPASSASPTGLPEPSTTAQLPTPTPPPPTAASPSPGLPSVSPRASLVAAPSPGPSSAPVNPPVPCSPGTRAAVTSRPAAPVVFAGSRLRRVIALTIDDGQSDQAVLADLAILRSQRVNATFFPIGQIVERSPSVWRTVAAAGFPIGNHTYDHADLACLGFEQAVADIRHDNQVVSAIIGRPLLPVLRPPGGAWDETVLQAALAGGERVVVIWDTTLADTGRGGVEQLVINGERALAGSIVLMHANGPLTQQALPVIIAHYRALGYGFVTLGELLGVPGPVPYPSGP